MENQKKSFFIFKGLFLFLCSCMYFLEFFFYYVFESPVDPGFTPDPIGDLKAILGLCVVKTCIVLLFIYILKKLNQNGIWINIYIIFITILSTLLYFPAISFNHSRVELLRIFMPIIANVLIIILLGNCLVKKLINCKKQ